MVIVISIVTTVLSRIHNGRSINPAPRSLLRSVQNLRDGHPSIAKHLNSGWMNPAGRENAKLIIYKVNSKTDLPTLTTAGSLYLRCNNLFVIDGNSCRTRVRSTHLPSSPTCGLTKRTKGCQPTKSCKV